MQRLVSSKTIRRDELTDYYYLLTQPGGHYHTALSTDTKPAVALLLESEMWWQERLANPEKGALRATEEPFPARSAERFRRREALQRTGYFVLEGDFIPTASLVEEAGRLGLRRQTEESMRYEYEIDTEKQLPETQHCREFIEAWSSKFRERRGWAPGRWAVLHSTAGCRAQQPRIDFPMTAEMREIKDCPPRLVAVFALQHGTAMNVWVGSHRERLTERIVPTCVQINPGTSHSLLFSFAMRDSPHARCGDYHARRCSPWRRCVLGQQCEAPRVSGCSGSAARGKSAPQGVRGRRAAPVYCSPTVHIAHDL